MSPVCRRALIFIRDSLFQAQAHLSIPSLAWARKIGLDPPLEKRNFLRARSHVTSEKIARKALAVFKLFELFHLKQQLNIQTASRDLIMYAVCAIN